MDTNGAQVPLRRIAVVLMVGTFYFKERKTESLSGRIEKSKIV